MLTDPIKVSVIKRGQWYHFKYRFDGNYVQKRAGTKDRKVVERRRIELEQQLNSDNPTSLTRVTRILFRDFVCVFIADHASEHYTPGYLYAIEKRCSIFIEHIGDKLLTGITSNDIRELLKSIKASRNLKNPSVNRYRTLLHKMYNFAIESGHAKHNPVTSVKKYKEDNRSKDFSYLNDAEIPLFLGACDKEFYPIAFTLVYTGIRIGELCGLKWDKINFATGFINVSNSFNGSTKDLEARDIPMNDQLIKILQGHFKAANGSPFVFPDSKGNMRGGDFLKRFRSTLRRANINKKLTIHDLRHTFATLFAKTGNIYSLMKLLGHSDLKTTERYIHSFKDGEYLKNEINQMPVYTEGIQNG